MPEWRTQWRKWLRVLHRDIGYIAAGLTIIYSVSGIAVNHVQDWNPNYVIDEYESNIGPLSDSLINGDTDLLVSHILKRIGESGKVKSSVYPDSNSIKIFAEGNTITADMRTGDVHEEQVKSRTVFRETNFLHLNAPKKIWTYVADIFAVALIFLAVSGLFIIKGKKGITGRGAWLTALGVLIPVIFYFIYF